MVRAAYGYPVAVQALYAPASAISIGEPLVALRPYLSGKPMLTGLEGFLETNLAHAHARAGWSKPLWQAVVIATMLSQLRTSETLTFPFPNAQALLALRDHPALAWAYLSRFEGD